MKSQLRGRFSGLADQRLHGFTSSLSIDSKLTKYDLQASIAHAKMLGKCKIISKNEQNQLVKGCNQLLKQLQQKKFDFDYQYEDIHMLIESKLVAICGPVGSKIHTARSRNDQTVTATRMWLRDNLKDIEKETHSFIALLIKLAKREYKSIMPGMTHLQFAQPITTGHLFLAWVQMLFRDLERIGQMIHRVNTLPLGSGALAGVGFAIDRRYTAELLGFTAISENSLDAVSDRDFIIEAISHASIAMIHLSRIAEDIIFYNSTALGFFTLSDRFATGSSMMPQKKNPDIAELIRGKTGIVIGNWNAIVTLMKSQNLSYNRDNQCDKDSLFSAMETWHTCLAIIQPMIASLKINHKKMEEACRLGYLTATEAADYLALKGMPFREAYTIVAQIVARATKRGCGLDELSLEVYRKYSTLFEKDILEQVSLSSAIKKRSSYGGTAPTEVLSAIKRAEKRLAKETHKKRNG